MKKYFNEKGEVVELGKEIACGGEGTVYDIDDSNVAKLYFDPKDRLSKMRAFINKGIHIKGVCIPNRLLFDENNNFYLCIYNHRTTKTNQKYPSVNL